MKQSKRKTLEILSLTPWLLPMAVILYGFTFLPLSAAAAAFTGAFFGLLLIKASKQ